MEDERLKHVCKFCKKRFACGRSLGGHIRCHLPKPGYRLRENPRKTWRVESLPSAAASLLSSSSSPSSDETDQSGKIRQKGKRSSINNSHSSFSEVVEEEEEEERDEQEDDDDDDDEESDVAFCLIMLSRDVGPWGKKVINSKRKRKVKKVEEDDHVEAAVNVAENQAEMRLENSKNNSTDDKSYCGNNNNNNSTKRGKNFECTTCNKVFHSYQALGGHKASHRRGVSSVWNSEQNSSLEKGRVFTDISLGTCPKVSNKIVQQKHECPFCFRVFGTGQALGGHKRSHLLGSGGSSSSETRDTIIELDLDLNLPPKQARDESNGNGNGITAASSSSSLVGLIKPYWWVEDHNKNEPFLSLVPN